MSKEDSLKWLAKGALFAFIGLVLSKLLNLIYRTIIARSLGPADYGLLNIGIAIFGIAAAASTLGLNQGAERFIGFYEGKSKQQKSVIRSSFKITLVISIISMILILLFSTPLARIFSDNPKLISVFIILGLAIPAYVLLELLISCMRGFKRMDLNTLIKQITEPSLKLILTIIFLYLGLSLLGAITAYVIAIFVAFGLSFYFIQKIIPKSKEKSLSLEKKLITFSWPLVLSSVLLNLMVWIDSLMIGYFTTENLVGLYNAASPIAALLWIPLLMFQSLFVPIISKHYAESNLKDINSIYQTMLRWIFLLVLPLLLFMFIFSKEIIFLFFGEAYLGSITVLRILLLSYFISSLFGPIDYICNAFGLTKQRLLIDGSSVILAIILNIILIPIWSIEGAALATLSAWIFLRLTFYTYLKFKVNLKLSSKKNIIQYSKVIFSSILALLISSYIFKFINIEITSITSIGLGILFISIYISLLLIIKALTKEDLLIINSIKNKIKI
ncbi:MAG: flippase [Nanoarchaeota archaeon]|nr:flippase [Nanoarchaeota archaeon]